jgi:hypothetical protein|tara:strand:+ start:678 stop:1196 length:519 start_codon:yes stop_codon:yes gene_type:complete
VRLTNKHNLPQPVVDSLTKDNYSRGSSNRSITQLIDSPRIRILRAEHDAEMTEDASDKVWSVLGTAVHNMFEDAASNKDHISEERLFAEQDGWEISGAIDLQEIEPDGSVTVSDYKCTSVWSVMYGKKEWVNQLNAYAWLVRHVKKVPVKKCQIVAVLRDWKLSELERQGRK